ncbi:MAG: bifunctional alpha,alpha-trehalose-phosphate synthase (UDP-forming)/trehalose-phosphatase [Acidobacteriota bacterium]
MPSPRLLIVSNRLPVAARLVDGQVRTTPASGGLATGLRPWHAQSNGLWIGWPGDVARFSPGQRAELDRRLHADGIVPLHLPTDLIDRYYFGYANRVVWPLFHYLIDRVPLDADGWDAYYRANERFAEAVAGQYRTGDAIWVHDYQLMLVPALLRQRLPGARIGFFLHIPFPSSEVFRTLPARRALLEGLLGADLIGFHTFGYMRHFVSSLRHVLGLEAEVDSVRVGDRDVALGAFPMGIDAEGFAALGDDPEVAAEAAAIRRDADGRQIVLGVDRLDYTKGIVRRLQAIEHLFARRPEYRDRLRYIQVAVPSRERIDSYKRFRRDVEETVGRINGTSGTVRSVPVHYIHRSVSPKQLAALYRAADVMLVTPLRDGMNLVAKEFAASRTDEDGVLVLSEFAGAAAELGGALVVNPYDIEGVADTLRRALTLPPDERRARMRTMRQRVTVYDIHAWVGDFVARLGARPAAARPRPAVSDTAALAAALDDARRAGGLHLLLDYDGTLVPFARTPEEASPDADLLVLLGALATAPGIDVAIVSGRPRETLESWFGELPIRLWAEHGFWHRAAPGQPWQQTASVGPSWASRVRPILEQFTAATPGSRLETKTASLAWHYREAAPDFGARQARELRMLLGEALSNQPLEVLDGQMVVEVRRRGVSKAVAAERRSADVAQGTTVAFGDDRTDEDLFRALPASSITVAVGRPRGGASFVVEDPHAVRQVLSRLLAAAQPGSGSPARALRTPAHASLV